MKNKILSGNTVGEISIFWNKISQKTISRELVKFGEDMFQIIF